MNIHTRLTRLQQLYDARRITALDFQQRMTSAWSEHSKPAYAAAVRAIVDQERISQEVRQEMAQARKQRRRR